jgi:two-component system nitrogen regulation response regulator NtrX
MAASKARPGGTPKILIVDDNQDLASLLQMMLEDEGYEVRLAKDGREGYLIYLLFGPDVIITDIQMPEKNGLQLIETIRIHNPRVRAIYMSGDLGEYSLPLEEEKTRYRVGLLEKPFSKVELMRLLSEVAF